MTRAWAADFSRRPSSRHGRMVDDLDEEVLRAVEVERAGAVAVGLGLRLQRHLVSGQMRGPGVDVGRRGDGDPDVIELTARRDIPPVERQIISTAVQVDVVGVGPPLDLVPHHRHPELLRRLEVADGQRDVTDPQQRRPVHRYPPWLAALSLAMNPTDFSGPLMWWLMISSNDSRQSRFTSADRVSRPASGNETCDRWMSAALASLVMGRPARAHPAQTTPPRSGSQGRRSLAPSLRRRRSGR